MNKTSIEWTDATWSPIRVRVKANAASLARYNGYTSLVQIAEKMAGRVGPHCEHVSPGCLNCYAETNNHRCLPANGTGLPYDRRSRDLVDAFVDEKILMQPLRWKEGRRIFVENQSDLFGEWVTDEMIDCVEAVMALCPQHTFQILTKRPERMGKYSFRPDRYSRLLDEASRFRADRPKLCSIPISDPALFPPPNIHRGVSCENQATADERIPLLLQTPAAVRFISAEPLLGPIDLIRVADGNRFHFNALSRKEGIAFRGTGLDWVIVGGESGPGARPMHPDWVRSLRDECVAARVPFFFKQWGEWLPLSDYDAFVHGMNANKYSHQFAWRAGVKNDAELPISCYRVGKKAAGAILEDREWRQFPAEGA